MSNEAVTFLPEIPSQPAKPGDVLVKHDVALSPQWFDAYKGPLGKEIPLSGNILYVGVPDRQHPEQTSHVMRMVSVENPYFNPSELQDGQHAITLFVMGGGSSDAITGLGMAANAMDGDQANKDGAFRIKNVVVLSHPDSQPRTMEHTDPTTPDSTLETSPDVVAQAVQLAQSSGNLVVEQERKMLGHSMGAHVAIDLAKPLNIDELILIEPTGIGEFPDIEHEFTFGSMYALVKDALRENKNPLTLPRRVLRKELQAFTGVYGPYKNIFSMIGSFIPGIMQRYQAVKEHQILGKAFGMLHPLAPALPNAAAIKYDNTAAKRNDFTGKVTLVEEMGAYVANALNANEGFSRDDLKQADEQTTAVLASQGKPPRTHDVLDKGQISGHNQLERLANRTTEDPDAMITRLFPNASRRLMVIDQGVNHRRMLDDATFYTRLFKEIKAA